MDIRQVAKQARVSTATVSRVINGSAPVSEKTTERVKQAIEKLNFFPNTHARTLGSGKSRIYGLIISEITNPFFPELVKSFEDIAVEHGQEVIVANTNYNLQRMELCVRRMIERKVDCVAIITSEMDAAMIELLDRRGIPIVFLDTGTVSQRASNIEVDYRGGIEQSVAHLAALGHKKIAFIATYLVGMKSGEMRCDAFREAMRRHKLPLTPELLCGGGGSAEGGRATMMQLLAMKDPPTAVVGTNDLTIIGALDAIRESGLRVPQDISVIGFDDIALSRYTNPPLTTVNIPREQLAKCAFTALYAVSQRGEAGRTYKIDVKLIVRESTAPPAQKSR